MIFIKVRPLVEGLKPLEQAYLGEWMDLRSAETVELEAGEYHRLRLGVAIQLPDECEAIIASRSSTFEKWGVMPVNGIGVIDQKYKGDDDEWNFPILAMRKTKIHKNDRICQFKVVPQQGKIKIQIVKSLGNNENRGGFGSTGVN